MPNKILAGPVLAALLGSAAVLFPVSSFAQTPPPAPPPAAAPAPPAAAKPAPAAPAPAAPQAGDEREKMRSAFKAYFDAKLAALHAGLELTPAQAPLWAPVEQAIRALAGNRIKSIHGHGDAGGSPLEKLQKRSEILSQRAKDLKALTDATGPLVQSLDANQKEHLPKLLEGAFKGRKVLWAAFNVESPERDPEGGQEGDRHHGRDHGGGEDGGGHEWHHWHHHHHWDQDGGDGHDSGEGHHWRHGDHEGGGDWHHHTGQDGDHT